MQRYFIENSGGCSSVFTIDVYSLNSADEKHHVMTMLIDNDERKITHNEIYSQELYDKLLEKLNDFADFHQNSYVYWHFE